MESRYRTHCIHDVGRLKLTQTPWTWWFPDAKPNTGLDMFSVIPPFFTHVLKFIYKFCRRGRFDTRSEVSTVNIQYWKFCVQALDFHTYWAFCSVYKISNCHSFIFRYLCEYIYYSSLHLQQGYCAFIHVPPIKRVYSDQQLADALRAVILKMIEQIKGQSWWLATRWLFMAHTMCTVEIAHNLHDSAEIISVFCRYFKLSCFRNIMLGEISDFSTAHAH